VDVPRRNGSTPIIAFSDMVHHLLVCGSPFSLPFIPLCPFYPNHDPRRGGPFPLKQARAEIEGKGKGTENLPFE